MPTTADLLVDSLLDWGVDTIFGLPGDGINGLMESLRQRQDRVRFVQTRHEESAAFMATGWAKTTHKLGVCLATSGPGGIHLLNGLYDAKLDGAPVLAITGLQFHDLIATHTQQDVELDKLFQDVALYNTRVMGLNHVENVVDLACRTALTHRGVSHITVPVDLQSQEWTGTRSKRNVPHHTSQTLGLPAPVADPAAVRQAAEVLNAGRKVCILAGQGALAAGDQLEQAAEILGAPIVKALLGKACVADESPYTTGSVGLLGTRPSQEALEECDTLLIVGSSFPYIESYPKPGRARGVQIDRDPARIGLRYPVEVGLVGDARATLATLLPLLRRHDDRAFLEQAQAGMREWWELMDERGTRSDKPMKPQVVAHELSKLLTDDAFVASDSGTIASWWARHIRARRGQTFTLSGNLASMANGLPYAIAAQVAFPRRQCVAFVGDGGFSMLMAEFATCVKYDLPVKVVVVKNNTLGQIKWEQMVFLGHPEYACDLHPIDFAAFARACGGQGFTVDDPADCGEVLRRALSHDGPVLVEAVVDPHEPPMPPKVTFEQARKFAESLVKGTPDRGTIAKTVLENKVRELV